MPHYSEQPVTINVTLDAIIRAINCPRRREVLVLLADRRLHGHAIVDLVSVDPGQLSRWMKRLKSAGLVEWESQGPSHIYGLTDLLTVRSDALYTVFEVRTATEEIVMRLPASDFAEVLVALRAQLEGP